VKDELVHSEPTVNFADAYARSRADTDIGGVVMKCVGVRVALDDL
jgi:hypothetical protein